MAAGHRRPRPAGSGLDLVRWDIQRVRKIGAETAEADYRAFNPRESRASVTGPPPAGASSQVRARPVGRAPVTNTRPGRLTSSSRWPASRRHRPGRRAGSTMLPGLWLCAYSGRQRPDRVSFWDHRFAVAFLRADTDPGDRSIRTDRSA